MGLTAPQLRAECLWPPPRTPLAANALFWLDLQLLGGAFAELELLVDGVRCAVQIVERVPAYTPPEPSYPMPPGWVSEAGAALYSVSAEVPLSVGASYQLTARCLAGYDNDPGTGSVRCATQPPSNVQARGEPELVLDGKIGAAVTPGDVTLAVQPHTPASGPGSGPSGPSGPPSPGGPFVEHALTVTTEEPVIVGWLAPIPRSAMREQTSELIHEGSADAVRARAWAVTGALVAQLG